MATDELEIERLLYAYAERLDAGDLDGVAALFAAATFRSTTNPAIRSGPAEVRTVFDSVILYDGVPRTKHVITNAIITLAGDAAESRCYFTVVQAHPSSPALQVVLAGRYHDRFVRDAGGWRFADRLVCPDFVGDLAGHMGAAGGR